MSLLGLFMLFLHLVSGAQITSVQLFHHELEANTGSSLLIPCKFHVDEPIHGERIKLEWGITPARGGSYTPIVRLSGTERLLMNNTYRQTGPSFLAKLDNGTCSIFISPVDQDDSGTYEVHLAVDDVEYRPIPKIKIHIRNKSGEDESPSITSATDHLKEDREPEGNGQKTMIKARGPNHERDENIDPRSCGMAQFYRTSRTMEAFYIWR
ncbi:uncharacterized protein [Hyperolius riggenbachi]|uniref:uncharacterized protein n=1 Tax=Hyperolius riggenbachi TaxID=752182 RepID=UPI0035A33DF7